MADLLSNGGVQYTMDVILNALEERSGEGRLEEEFGEGRTEIVAVNGDGDVAEWADQAAVVDGDGAGEVGFEGLVDVAFESRFETFLEPGDVEADLPLNGLDTHRTAPRRARALDGRGRRNFGCSCFR